MNLKHRLKLAELVWLLKPLCGKKRRKAMDIANKINITACEKPGAIRLCVPCAVMFQTDSRTEKAETSKEANAILKVLVFSIFS